MSRSGSCGAQIGLRCLVCGQDYGPGEIDYVCPRHGDDGIVDVLYDYDRIGRNWSPGRIAREEPSMWRYRGLLPVDENVSPPPLRIGWTPLYRTDRLARSLGLTSLWTKDEGVQPTGSLKDRASAVAIVKAEEAGAHVVTTASTGNAAAALAGVAASVGMPAVIFVPATAPEAKVAQLLAYGSGVLLVEGSYDDAVELCLQSAGDLGWYNRTTGYNPYMSEGKKTAALEIAEQMGWQVPDVVVVSVGDGCIIGGLYKGFHDLLQLGWIDRTPRLLGIQSTGSNYLAEAWEQGDDVLTKPRIDAHTVADSIAAGLPRDRIKAMRAVRESGGAFVTVDDRQILGAIPTLAAEAGIFAEPAAAASLAGLETALRQGLVGEEERIVLMSTGTGLKDVGAAMRAVDQAGIRPRRLGLDVGEVAVAAREILSKERR